MRPRLPSKITVVLPGQTVGSRWLPTSRHIVNMLDTRDQGFPQLHTLADSATFSFCMAPCYADVREALCPRVVLYCGRADHVHWQAGCSLCGNSHGAVPASRHLLVQHIACYVSCATTLVHLKCSTRLQIPYLAPLHTYLPHCAAIMVHYMGQ